VATKDERRAELERQMAELDAEPDEPAFSVAWWEESPDGSKRGGEMPWSQGQRVFGKWFPDLFGDKPAEPARPGKDKGSGGRPSDGTSDDSGTDTTGAVRFGRRLNAS